MQADYIGQRKLKHEARKVREIAQKTCMEATWYLAPPRAQLLVDSVAATLNATVLRFIRRNPSFSGGISVLAHSLGSAMVCDLLAHQPLAPHSALGRVFAGHGGAFAAAAAAEPTVPLRRPPRPPQPRRGSESSRSGRAAARVAAVAALQEHNAQRLGEVIHSGGRSSASSSRQRLLAPSGPEASGIATPRISLHGTPDRDGDSANGPDTPGISPPEPDAVDAAPIGEAGPKARRIRSASRKSSSSKSRTGLDGMSLRTPPGMPALPLQLRQDGGPGTQPTSASAEGASLSSNGSSQRPSLGQEYSLRPSSLGTMNDAISVSGWGADGSASADLYPDSQQATISLRLPGDLANPAASPSAPPSSGDAAGSGGGGFMWLSPRPPRTAWRRSRVPSRGDSRTGSSGSAGYNTAHSTITSNPGSNPGSNPASLGGSLGQPLGEGRERKQDAPGHSMRSQSVIEPYSVVIGGTVVHPSSISETGTLSRVPAASAIAESGSELFYDAAGEFLAAGHDSEHQKDPPSPGSPLLARFRPGRGGVQHNCDDSRRCRRAGGVASPGVDRTEESEEATSSRELEMLGSLALRSWPREGTVATFSNRGVKVGAAESSQHFTSSTTTATGAAIDLRADAVPFWSGSVGWNSAASSDAARLDSSAAPQWMPMHEVPDFPPSPSQAVDVKGRRGDIAPVQRSTSAAAGGRNASEIDRHGHFTFAQPLESSTGSSSRRASATAESESRRSRGGSGEVRRSTGAAAASVQPMPQTPSPLRSTESAAGARGRATALPTPALAGGSAIRRRGTDPDFADRYQLGDLQVRRRSPFAHLVRHLALCGTSVALRSDALQHCSGNFCVVPGYVSICMFTVGMAAGFTPGSALLG